MINAQPIKTISLSLSLCCGLNVQAQTQVVQNTDPNSTAAVGNQARLPPITINANRPVGVNNLISLSDTPLSQTPVTLSITTSEAIRNLGHTSLSALMRNEPAAGDAYNTLGYVESLSVRGFLLDNRFNYQRDGLPISNHMPIVFENKERFELLKGTAGMFSGVSAPGGLLNAVVKRPLARSLTEVGSGVSEKGTAQIYADISRQHAQTGLGYRFNFAASRREPYADAAPGQRSMASAAIDFKRSAHVFEAEVELARSRQISVPGLGLLDTDGDGTAETLPVLPSARLNLNNQSWALPFESSSRIGSIRYEYRLFEQADTSVKVGLRANHQSISTNDRIAFPDGCSSAANYVYPGLCANYDVDIYDYRSDNEKRVMRNAQAWLAAKFSTGPLRHELKLSVLRNRYYENFEPLQAYNYAGTINALAPTALDPQPDPSSTNTQYARASTEIALSDVIRMNDVSQLWLGIRNTRLTTNTINTDGSNATAISQSFVTPWVALSYRVHPSLLSYLSFGQAVESEVVPNRPSRFANAGQALPALRSSQWELGLKWTTPALQSGLAQGQLNASIYSIKKPFSDDVIVQASDDLPTRIAGARNAKNEGIEVQWQQQIAPTIDLLTALSVLNARQVNDAQGLFIGKRTTNVEPISATVSLGWQPTGAIRWQNTLTFNAGKPVTRDNAVTLPASFQWDTWANYQFTSGNTAMTFRFGIDNVLNRRYWRDAPTQSWGGTYLFAASARTLRLSLQANL